MKEAGIFGGIIVTTLGICVIRFPFLLAWVVGVLLIITGAVYILQWIKK